MRAALPVHVTGVGDPTSARCRAVHRSATLAVMSASSSSTFVLQAQVAVHDVGGGAQGGAHGRPPDADVDRPRGA